MYSRKHRDLAYELWRVNPEQPFRAVAKDLALLIRREIPPNTIAEWARTDEWEGRWALERMAMSPRMVERHVEGLRVAAPDMIEKLRAFVCGDLELSMAQVLAAKAIISENRVAISMQVDASKRGGRGKLATPPTMSELKAKEQSLSRPPSIDHRSGDERQAQLALVD